MKKTIIFMLLTGLLFSNCIPINAQTKNSTIEFLGNGDYVETIIIEDNTLSQVRATTKSGTKTTYYKNSSGTIMWSVSVKGTFSYTGSSSTCTNATVSTTCPSVSWRILSSSSSRSGNVAKATATAGQFSANIEAKRLTRTVSLTCSANGTLS